MGHTGPEFESDWLGATNSNLSTSSEIFAALALVRLVVAGRCVRHPSRRRPCFRYPRPDRGCCHRSTLRFIGDAGREESCPSACRYGSGRGIQSPHPERLWGEEFRADASTRRGSAGDRSHRGFGVTHPDCRGRPGTKSRIQCRWLWPIPPRHLARCLWSCLSRLGTETERGADFSSTRGEAPGYRSHPAIRR